VLEGRNQRRVAPGHRKAPALIARTCAGANEPIMIGRAGVAGHARPCGDRPMRAGNGQDLTRWWWLYMGAFSLRQCLMHGLDHATYVRVRHPAVDREAGHASVGFGTYREPLASQSISIPPVGMQV
jgi:hypothetical protein